MSNPVAVKGAHREGSGAVGNRGRVRYKGVNLIMASLVLLPQLPPGGRLTVTISFVAVGWACKCQFFSGPSAPTATYPYRSEQTTGLAGGYDC